MHLVRKELSAKLNSCVSLTATFGGIHFPKGGNFIGRTLLFTNVLSYPNGEPISNHMWARTNNYMQYSSLQKGDTVRVIGTVIKYFKYNNIKRKSDFSIEITSCEKINPEEESKTDLQQSPKG